jgi:amino acid transporter
MNDETGLQSLGYKQELTRSLNRLTNYGMTLSALSSWVGVALLFGYGLVTGGPVVMVWGWLVVSFFNLCISLGLAEICSAFPTAGGLYYWTAILVPERYRAIASWFTGWANLTGQLAAVASADFGSAMLVSSTISIGVGQWSPRPWHLVAIHICLMISHGLCNSMGRRVLLGFTHVSTWWQLVAPSVIAIALLANLRDSHHAAHFAFTTYVNRTGWTNNVSTAILIKEKKKVHYSCFSKVYVILIGLLQAQFCLGGYDSAAHMSEETKRADVASPLGMVGALIGSSAFGWFFIVALLMGVKDYRGTIETSTGFPVAQILLDNFGRSWTLVLMCLLLVGCWFCGLITVTSTSRLMYAFSRDHALVRKDLRILIC